MKISNDAPVLTHRVRDAVRITGIGRSTLYGHIRAGRLKTVKSGGMRLVPDTSLGELLQLGERQADGNVELIESTVASRGNLSPHAKPRAEG